MPMKSRPSGNTGIEMKSIHALTPTQLETIYQALEMLGLEWEPSATEGRSSATARKVLRNIASVERALSRPVGKRMAASLIERQKIRARRGI